MTCGTLRLVRIDIEGFKSFRTRTVLDLRGRGSLTCIVGSNGTGKSNIFDAICFGIGIGGAGSGAGYDVLRCNTTVKELISRGESGGYVCLVWEVEGADASQPPRRRFLVRRTLSVRGKTPVRNHWADVDEACNELHRPKKLLLRDLHALMLEYGLDVCFPQRFVVMQVQTQQVASTDGGALLGRLETLCGVDDVAEKEAAARVALADAAEHLDTARQEAAQLRHDVAQHNALFDRQAACEARHRLWAQQAAQYTADLAAHGQACCLEAQESCGRAHHGAEAWRAVRAAAYSHTEEWRVEAHRLAKGSERLRAALAATQRREQGFAAALKGPFAAAAARVRAGAGAAQRYEALAARAAESEAAAGKVAAELERRGEEESPEEGDDTAGRLLEGCRADATKSCAEAARLSVHVVAPAEAAYAELCACGEALGRLRIPEAKPSQLQPALAELPAPTGLFFTAARREEAERARAALRTIEGAAVLCPLAAVLRGRCEGDKAQHPHPLRVAHSVLFDFFVRCRMKDRSRVAAALRACGVSAVVHHRDDDGKPAAASPFHRILDAPSAADETLATPVAAAGTSAVAPALLDAGLLSPVAPHAEGSVREGQACVVEPGVFVFVPEGYTDALTAEAPPPGAVAAAAAAGTKEKVSARAEVQRVSTRAESALLLAASLQDEAGRGDVAGTLAERVAAAAARVRAVADEAVRRRDAAVREAATAEEALARIAAAAGPAPVSVASLRRALRLEVARHAHLSAQTRTAAEAVAAAADGIRNAAVAALLADDVGSSGDAPAVEVAEVPCFVASEGEATRVAALACYAAAACEAWAKGFAARARVLRKRVQAGRRALAAEERRSDAAMAALTAAACVLHDAVLSEVDGDAAAAEAEANSAAAAARVDALGAAAAPAGGGGVLARRPRLAVAELEAAAAQLGSERAALEAEFAAVSSGLDAAAKAAHRCDASARAEAEAAAAARAEEEAVEALEDEREERVRGCVRSVNERVGEVLREVGCGMACVLVLLPGAVAVRAKLAGSPSWIPVAKLSGGQRALVSTVITVALTRVFPSPLHLLDEVDAALDPNLTAKVSTVLAASPTPVLCISLRQETISQAAHVIGVYATPQGSRALVANFREG